MPSVQFTSAADIIKAFDNTDCAAWSLWDNKRFTFKGIGSADLQSFLELLEESGGGNCTYTLCYYETITEKKDINSKTPVDGSFTFRMDGNTSAPRELSKHGVSLVSRMNGLDEKFNLILEKLEGGTETTEINNLGIVGDLLSHPQLGPMLTGIISNIATKFLTTDPRPKVETIYPAPRLGQVAGIGNAVEQNPVLENAIAKLCALDPRLPDHLEKLAAIGERDPATFQYILNTLDNLKLNEG